METCNMRLALRLALLDDGGDTPDPRTSSRSCSTGCQPAQAALLPQQQLEGRQQPQWHQQQQGHPQGPPPADAVGSQRMLLLEAPGTTALAAGPAPADPHDGLISSAMGLENTLLASALAHREARFVADCSNYLQVRRSRVTGPSHQVKGLTVAAFALWDDAARCGGPRRPIFLHVQLCKQPARDIFGRSPEPVASVVVVPILPPRSSDAIGAVYFTSDTPVNFANVQDLLLVSGKRSK